MEISKNSDIILFISIGIVLLFTLSFSIVLFFRVYRRNIIKQQQKFFEAEQLYKEDLLFNNINSTELERSRIARDIHDEIGNIFATLSMVNNQKIENSFYAEKALQIENLIDVGITATRNIAHQMMPVQLEELGLAYALQELCDNLEGSGNIEVNLNCSKISFINKKSVELPVYRILQELISNTLKHSKAGRVEINFETEKNKMVINYQDNGIGMDPEVFKNNRGMGIKNIESRTKLIGGDVEFITGYNKGFNCIIKFPL